MVKNLPSNGGDVGSIPGQGTKIPHATGQLSPRTLDPSHHNWRAHVLQLLSPCTTTREKPTRHKEDPMQPKK